MKCQRCGEESPNYPVTNVWQLLGLCIGCIELICRELLIKKLDVDAEKTS